MPQRWVEASTASIPSLIVEQASHFGREAQEYSAEALQWLRDTVQGKRMWCQLLHRDQYGRIVRLLPLSIGNLCLTARCTGCPSNAPNMDTIPVSERLDRDA